MSIRTTGARFDANAADREWRQHRTRDCAACSTASRSRKWPDLCPRGADLRARAADTARVLAYEVKLDRAPGPDRAALF